MKSVTTTTANENIERTMYNYTLAPDEIHSFCMLIFEMSGAYSNASASDDFTVRFKIAGNTISTIIRSGGNVTDSGWKGVFEATVRTSGAVSTLVHFTSLHDGSNIQGDADTVGNVIDTTVALLFEVTVQWDTAKVGNTLSCTQGNLQFRH